MNILLCCAAGMSSSLIVTKMEKAAEARGIEVKIWAVSGSEVNSHIDKADVLFTWATSTLFITENEGIM